MRFARLRTDAGPRSVVRQGALWVGVEDPFARPLVFTGTS